MTNVTVTNALYRNTDITGTFQLLEEYKPHTDLEHTSGKDGRIKIVHPLRGALGLNVNLVDVAYDDIAPLYTAETEQVVFDRFQADIDIAERFTIQEELIEGVVNGFITSLIIAGAAGVGKSYAVENRLKEAAYDGEIVSVKSLKGRTTGIGLYEMLWENREPGQVLVLDDIDSVFQDENALNLLKAALDTSLVREISWNTMTNTKAPSMFQYEGAIIFITNLNFDRMIAKDNRMTPHYQALLSRSLYLDHKVHSLAEIFIRSEQVVGKSNMLDKLDLEDEMRDQLMGWITSNYQSMRELSLRTVIKLAGIMQSSENWERTAVVTLLK